MYQKYSAGDLLFDLSVKLISGVVAIVGDAIEIVGYLREKKRKSPSAK